MTTDNTDADAATTADAGTDTPSDMGGAGYTPPATQADLDRIIADRVNRTKAQFKDYNDLKAKAAERDQLVAANQTESERLAGEATRWQTEAERWRSSSVMSTIAALAASDFADPTDAAATLNPSKYLDAGGEIDQDAIRADLADLLERKPHWRRPEGGAQAPRLPVPNPAQGSSGTNAAADPAQQFASILQGQLRS